MNCQTGLNQIRAEIKKDLLAMDDASKACKRAYSKEKENKAIRDFVNAFVHCMNLQKKEKQLAPQINTSSLRTCLSKIFG